MMLQQKGKKVFIYLFLFVIVGSINNTTLTKNQFGNIKNIKISGLNEKENINLLENIISLNLKNIFVLQGNEISKINFNGKTSIIGSNGKLSDIKFSDQKLPFIFGKPQINEFIKFTNIIEQSRFSLSEVKNLYFFPSKRWDIELRNNVILKLSKDHTRLSLDQAFEILNDNNFDNIKVVDARIKNQIILND